MYTRVSNINISSITVHIRFRSFSTLYTYNIPNWIFRINTKYYTSRYERNARSNCHLKNWSQKRQVQSALLGAGRIRGAETLRIGWGCDRKDGIGAWKVGVAAGENLHAYPGGGHAASGWHKGGRNYGVSTTPLPKSGPGIALPRVSTPASSRPPPPQLAASSSRWPRCCFPPV